MIDIAALTVSELKILLEREGEHIGPLLTLMLKDERKSVRKLAEGYSKKEERRKKEEARLQGMLKYETMFYHKGAQYIAGIDEVGRGPVAGPVTVAAVILPAGWTFPGINDSKKIPPEKREVLYDAVMDNAVAVSCICKSEKEIDALDIYHATQQAMYEAVAALAVRPDAVLVDAMPLPGLGIAHASLIGGDSRSLSIAAASIIAKVTRDRIMVDYDARYPQYGFAGHKGYLTQRHRDAIAMYGPCPIHRRSFEPVRSMVHFHR